MQNCLRCCGAIIYNMHIPVCVHEYYMKPAKLSEVTWCYYIQYAVYLVQYNYFMYVTDKAALNIPEWVFHVLMLRVSTK